MHQESEQPTSSETRGTKARLAEAWQSTLGRFATAEEGSRNMVQRLVEWGKLTREEGRSLLTDWRKSIEDNRRHLEQRVEEAVHKSLVRFRIPSQAELHSLANQVDTLEQRIRELSKRRTRDPI